MPQPAYAIRCSTEEQARECSNKWFTAIINWTVNMCENITYEEAQSLWLLREEWRAVTMMNGKIPRMTNEEYQKRNNIEPQQNEVQEVKSVIITKEDEIALWWSESPSEVQKTQEEITADEQMEINEMINEESPSEDWIDRTYKKLFWEIWWMTKENFRNTISKESPSEDNLVGLIMRDLHAYKEDEWTFIPATIIRKVLEKHLLSK